MAIPLRIAGENLIDGASLTASSAVSGLGVDNLRSDDIQEVWRATSTTANVVADLGSSQSIGVVALNNTNAGATDSVRVRLSTVDSTGAAGDSYDSGTVATAVDQTYPIWLHFIEPEKSGRYLRIDLTQSSAPEAGRMLVAPTWTPTHNFSFGWHPLWRDWSIRTASLGQNLFFDRRPRQRGFSFRLFGLTESEAGTHIEPINRLRGTSADILVCRNKDSSTLGKVTVWGPMEAPIIYPQRHPDFFDAEFVVWNRL